MIEENTENRITSLEQEMFLLREQTILTHRFLEEIKEEVEKNRRDIEEITKKLENKGE